jgi:hypothetical protein
MCMHSRQHVLLLTAPLRASLVRCAACCLDCTDRAARDVAGRHCVTWLLSTCRYVQPLEAAHDAEHLVLFEELLEAAIDLDRIPDEYLIAASYDPELGDLAAAKADAEAAIERAAQGVEREPCCACVLVAPSRPRVLLL